MSQAPNLNFLGQKAISKTKEKEKQILTSATSFTSPLSPKKTKQKGVAKARTNVFILVTVKELG